jgi:hypothetical protein
VVTFHGLRRLTSRDTPQNVSLAEPEALRKLGWTTPGHS